MQDRQDSGRLNQAGFFVAAVLLAYGLMVFTQTAEARRTNIQGGNTYDLLFDHDRDTGKVASPTALQSEFEIVDTNPITSSAVPVGLVEDACAEISIRGLGASEDVTVRTLGLINSNSSKNTVGYHVPLTTAAETVFSNGDTEEIMTITFPGGLETLQWVFETTQNSSVTIKFIAGTQ